MSDTIKFGTDGWRGVIAEDYTFDNVRRAAQGFASYMQEVGHTGSSIVLGYDKRFGSEHFAAAVAEVLAGNNFRVHLTDGPTPTPVIAYAVLERKSAGAVNITASHNPPTDNGFKVRTSTQALPYKAQARALRSFRPVPIHQTASTRCCE